MSSGLNFLKINNLKLPKLKKPVEINFDNRIKKIGKPLFIEFLVHPILSILDSVIISKLLGIELLAVQSLGDQLFYIFYNFFSFIPPILQPLITKMNIEKNSSFIPSNLLVESITITSILGFLLMIIFNIFGNQIIFSGLFISNKIDKEKSVGSEDKRDIFNSRLNNYFANKSILFPLLLTNDILKTFLKGLSNEENQDNLYLLVQINFLSNLAYFIGVPIVTKYYGLNGINNLNLFIEILRFCIFGYKILSYYEVTKIKPVSIFRKYYNLLSFNIFMKSCFNRFLFFLSNGIFIKIKNLVRKTSYMKINNRILNFDDSGLLLGFHIILCKTYDLLHTLFKCMAAISTILIPEELSKHELIERKSIHKEKQLYFFYLLNRLRYWIHSIGLGQLFLCLLLKFTYHHLNLIHFVNLFPNNQFMKPLIDIVTSDGFKLSMKHIIENIVIVNITCYISSLVEFIEIILQSKGIYKIHSFLSIIFSIGVFLSLGFVDNLNKIWINSLIFTCLKYISFLIFFKNEITY